MPNPILPRNLSNPVMTGQITKRAVGYIRRAARRVRRDIIELFNAIPRQRVDADSGVVINSELPDDHWLHVNQNIIYEYQLSAEILRQISDEIDLILRRAYLGTDLESPLSDWYMYTAADSSYNQGTAMSVANLNNIAPEYNRDLFDVISTPAYANRIALVRARVFENMEGLTGSAKADLSDTLARGMQSGLNPREIAKRIGQRVEVSESRALRIARTEINTAHRRATWDEDRDARERLGIKTKLMHISALLPTTRRTHADRNGNLYTSKEVEEWYSVSSNAINCRCSQVSVLVDEDGAVLDKKLQKRLQAKGDAFFKAHPDN